MSKSTTTHRAALKALATLLEAAKVHGDFSPTMAYAMVRAKQVLDDTAAVSPADRYTAAKQAKQAAKAALKKQA